MTDQEQRHPFHSKSSLPATPRVLSAGTVACAPECDLPKVLAARHGRCTIGVIEPAAGSIGRSSATIPHSADAFLALDPVRALDFQDKHVPLGQSGRARSRNRAVRARRRDRLSVEDERTNPGDLVHLQHHDLALVVERRAAEPASQDAAARGRRGPSGPARSAAARSDSGEPAARHAQPPRSRIRCSVTRQSPLVRAGARHGPRLECSSTRRPWPPNFKIHPALVWSSRLNSL